MALGVDIYKHTERVDGIQAGETHGVAQERGKGSGRSGLEIWRYARLTDDAAKCSLTAGASRRSTERVG